MEELLTVQMASPLLSDDEEGDDQDTFEIPDGDGKPKEAEDDDILEDDEEDEGEDVEEDGGFVEEDGGDGVSSPDNEY